MGIMVKRRGGMGIMNPFNRFDFIISSSVRRKKNRFRKKRMMMMNRKIGIMEDSEEKGSSDGTCEDNSG